MDEWAQETITDILQQIQVCFLHPLPQPWDQTCSLLPTGATHRGPQSWKAAEVIASLSEVVAYMLVIEDEEVRKHFIQGIVPPGKVKQPPPIHRTSTSPSP